MTDELQIKQARLDSNACIAKKDVDGVAKYWMPDFVQIAGDGSHTIGKAKIAADWKYMFARESPLFERLPQEIKISENGSLAWESGTWNYKNAAYHGNYSAMWRKVKGKWLTQCELYVSLN
uniref:YybH family protein n=1 Tax=Pedobacter schmidteae TaxID=2201271 RepID=UPI000EAC8A5D|nr:nuclear transport factor 2 family protein [Pedobacter schmidteae]